MTPLTITLLVLAGLLIGTFSGMVGIGGGILVIPILMYAFGFTQPRANGTSLAMLLPPIGLLAVLTYHRAGNVDWRYAMLLAAGFAVGSYMGARLVTGGHVNPVLLRYTFAALLAYTIGRLLLSAGQPRVRPAEAVAVAAAGVGGFLLLRRVRRRIPQRPTEYDYEI